MIGTYRLWIVLADGEHARVVVAEPGGHFRTLRQWDAATAHQRARDLASDRPGRVVESVGDARHAVAPRTDLHAAAKESFLRSVAQELGHAAQAGTFDRLVLVAPPRALPVLRGALDQGTTRHLSDTLEKDLVKVPDADLPDHLTSFRRLA